MLKAQDYNMKENSSQKLVDLGLATDHHKKIKGFKTMKAASKQQRKMDANYHL